MNKANSIKTLKIEEVAKTYLAKRQKDGTILRLSVTTISMGRMILSMITEIVAGLFLSLLLAIFLSSGLAKSIVKHAVSCMGGSIELTSEVDGTEVKISLLKA